MAARESADTAQQTRRSKSFSEDIGHWQGESSPILRAELDLPQSLQPAQPELSS